MLCFVLGLFAFGDAEALREIVRRIDEQARLIPAHEFSAEGEHIEFDRPSPSSKKLISYSVKWKSVDEFRIDWAESGSNEEASLQIGKDGRQRILTKYKQQGVFGAVVAAQRADGYLAAPHISMLLPDALLRTVKRQSRTEKASVRETGRGIEILVQGARYARHLVDPSKGFRFLEGDAESTFTDLGVVKTFYRADLMEISSEHWITSRCEFGQTTDGKKVYKTELRMVGKPRLLDASDASQFTVVFPKGTRISDSIANRTYFEGGDTRDPASLKELAAQTQMQVSDGDAAPMAGALRATAPSSSWQLASQVLATVSLAALLASGAIVWQRRRKTG